MTARQLFEATIIEMNKEQAPSLLLEEFNYMANKAINQYINKRYSTGYDINQQFTDDVRVLKSTAILYAEAKPKNKDVTSLDAFLNDAKYEFNLPDDYLHLLNCSCIYKVNKRYNCYDAGTYWEAGATRLTADIAPVILNNYYMRPSYKKPYYYINNRNIDTTQWDADQELVPTNPAIFEAKTGSTADKLDATLNSGTDTSKRAEISYTQGGGVAGKGKPQSITIPNVNGENEEFIDLRDQNLPRFRKQRDNAPLDDTVERTAGHRYGNASKVRLEIRYGKDNSVFELVAIKVDYIKAPQHIRLTQEQIDLTEDTSQILEFPDYVCQEIINELVKLIMENAGDPRTGTHPIVTQSIASPAQEQAPKSKK